MARSMDDVPEDPVRRDGSVVQCSSFHFEITNEAWKKYFVMAVLKVIHEKENLEPACHTIYSVDSLQHVLDTQDKIWRGLKSLVFGEVYDTWKGLMDKNGVVHAHLNHDDFDFIKRMTTPVKNTEVTLTEIMSFNKQGLAFTYELLGLHHQDIDEILDWMRSRSDDNRFWSGLDEVDFHSSMNDGIDEQAI